VTTKGAPALIPAQKGRRLKRVMGVTYACDRGYDACSWVVGISSAGLFGAAYARVTEELTRVWTCALLRLQPAMSFCSCSVGSAGDPGLWARVRRRVEGALEQLPFRAYQMGGVLLPPRFLLRPLLVRFMPFVLPTSETLGRAMLRVVQGQADRCILASADINRVGA